METTTLQKMDDKNNKNQLNLLSIFYFVFGGLNIIGSMILFIYMLLFGYFLKRIPSTGDDADTILNIFASIFGTLAATMLIIGVLQIIAGFKLRQNTHRVFCLIVAILVLPMFPLGTMLGIFSIILLSRRSVKDLYFRRQEEIQIELYGMKRNSF